MKSSQSKVQNIRTTNLFSSFVDWDDAENVQIDLEQWETNWDDEIIEDDFAVQLQREVAKLQQQQHLQQQSSPQLTAISQ